MKIVFYCQYVLGMGHFFRSLQIAGALSDHTVTLVVGGQPVKVRVPDHVRLVRLPVLYMDEGFTRLITDEPGQDPVQVQRLRQDRLMDLLDRVRPDLFIVELYPFGRTVFQFELDPLLDAIGAGAFGNVGRVCSLRDVLVEKRDPIAYEQRVLDKLNSRFDLLLVHSDRRFLRLEETFGRVDDIAIPTAYTGFVTRRPARDAAARVRSALGLSPGDRLVVASAGGGRTGGDLLAAVAAACRTLQEPHRVRLALFTGPFMEPAAFDRIAGLAGPGVSVRRFTPRLLDYMAAADLSISMAGYNTCMDLLVTRTPSLVYPYARQQEQPLRAGKIQPLLPMRVMGDRDLEPEALRNHILHMLQTPRPEKPLALNLDGAANTARILVDWKHLRNDSW